MASPRQVPSRQNPIRLGGCRPAGTNNLGHQGDAAGSSRTGLRPPGVFVLWVGQRGGDDGRWERCRLRDRIAGGSVGRLTRRPWPTAVRATAERGTLAEIPGPVCRAAFRWTCVRRLCPEPHFHPAQVSMVVVFIPPAWRDLTAGRAEVRLAAMSVRQVIEGLEALYPGIAARALADDSLKPGLAVSINGTISRRGLRGAVPEGAEVHFLPALGGG